MNVNAEYIVGYCMSTINRKLCNNDFSQTNPIMIEIPYFTYWYVESNDDVDASYDNRIIIYDDARKASFESFITSKQPLIDESIRKHFHATFQPEYHIVSSELILEALNPKHSSCLRPFYRIMIERGNYERS